MVIPQQQPGHDQLQIVWENVIHISMTHKECGHFINITIYR